LVDHLVETSALTTAQREPALEALKAREEHSSTGIGGGIAIPHAKLPHLDEIVMVFGRSTPGVDFYSLDRAPVHYIILFLVPENQQGNHLKTLAAIAKTLNSAETRKLLSTADDAAGIMEILTKRGAS
jgi:mannitol/fructose-specific phosphotransferase system IIA component (Ntr-type)